MTEDWTPPPRLMTVREWVGCIRLLPRCRPLMKSPRPVRERVFGCVLDEQGEEAAQPVLGVRGRG